MYTVTMGLWSAKAHIVRTFPEFPHYAELYDACREYLNGQAVLFVPDGKLDGRCTGAINGISGQRLGGFEIYKAEEVTT